MSQFNSHTPGLSSPCANAAAITPGAGALTNQPRAVFVGTVGDITVTMNGTSVTLKNVASGTLLPIRPTHVTAATAGDIVGLW